MGNGIRRYDGTFDIIFEVPDLPWRHSIRPHEIDTNSSELASHFGKHEIACSAAHLVTFFQQNGFWRRFKIEEYHSFLRSRGMDPKEALFGLAGEWFDDAEDEPRWREPADVFIIIDEKGYHYVTDRFIERWT